MAKFRAAMEKYALGGSEKRLEVPQDGTNYAISSDATTAVLSEQCAPRASTSSQTTSRKRSRSPESVRETPLRPNKRACGIPRETDIVPSPSKMPVRGDPTAFADLHALTDRLAVGQDIVFCGFNPGVISSKVQAHYGNPQNAFWKCLYASGLTSRLVKPTEEQYLLSEFSLGLTDLVSRPTAGAHDLTPREMLEAVPTLLSKIAHFRPTIMCCVGKQIWDIILKAHDKATNTKGKLKSKTLSEGIQPFVLLCPTPVGDFHRTMFFVMKSTSGRVTNYPMSEKEAAFTKLRSDLQLIKANQIDSTSFTPLAIPISLQSKPHAAAMVVS
ncbi:uracil-DNA glycosylase-like protein [Auriculariales sp. MPI-PUGE-AT-0066]|nr:uracil-DNA glycosylase-like protein [Auriculariales sp. MPI-PUGE-AT-0066]